MSLHLLKKDDVHEFKPILSEIEHDPGNPLGPLTFWLVVAVFAFFLLWTIFGQVDVVVTGRGKVVPTGQVKMIQPLNGGVVSQILVKEGDFVHKGQPLIVIDPSTTEPGLKSSQENLEHLQLEQNRLSASSGNGRFDGSNGSGGSQTQARLYQASLGALKGQLGAKQKAMGSLDAQIQARKAQLEQSRADLAIQQEKAQRLEAVKDIVAKDTYEKAQNDIETTQTQMEVLSKEVAQLDYQKQQTRQEMAYIQQNFSSSVLSELSEKEKQITQLKAQIEESQFRNAQQTLVSPVDGYVHELFVHTVGGVVTPAEKVVSVVPVNTPLQVQAIVLNKDIGFVKEGMPVSIKVDTYDFQKYGTLQGIVSHIDKDSRDDEHLGPVYMVYIEPKQHSLKIDGKWQDISTGLSTTAEIKTGKRRIIEFFIYPLIKHLDEGMSVR